jgi:hypothetical protein
MMASIYLSAGIMQHVTEIAHFTNTAVTTIALSAFAFDFIFFCAPFCSEPIRSEESSTAVAPVVESAAESGTG